MTRLESRLNGHHIRTDFSPDLPLVLSDGVLMEQVLVNLLENALKFSPPSAAIELSATASDRELIFGIADRGPGIPAGDEQRIFDKFYRAGPAREGGMGLGLTICRGIIEAHGGRIWVEKRPGGGALFRFTLPIEQAQPTIEPEQTERHPVV